MINYAFKLGAFDYAFVILYFISILFLGFKVKNKGNNTFLDFVLAGRKVSLPLFVGTLVATWYGNILGMGEFVYNSGILSWLCMGLPYYIAATAFAFLFAAKIRKSNFSSIPETIKKSFGRKAGYISSIIILFLTIPAAYVLMLGVILQMLVNIPLWVSVIAGSALSLIYLFNGGYKADVITNSAQFVFMYLGFGLLLVFSIIHYGPISQMAVKLPYTHLHTNWAANWQLLLVWFIIAFQTFVDPSFHQRCASAKNPQIARNGVLISVIFWILFDFLTLTTGLYARAFIPNLSAPILAYPVLGDTVLPAFLKGIFIVSILATVMSTLDSYAFISAVTIGNDLLNGNKFLSKFNKSGGDNNWNIKIGLIISSVLSIIIAIAIPSAIDIILKTSSVAIPGLLLPLVIAFSKRYQIKKGMAAIVVALPSAISLIWIILGYILVNSNFILRDLFINLEPMIPGFAVSVVLVLLFIQKGKKEAVYVDNI